MFYLCGIGTSTAETTYDPDFGPWNTVQCRSGKILVLPLNQQNAHGVVVAMDIFPYAGGTYPQTLFAFRNPSNNQMSVTVELYNNFQVYAWQHYGGSWQNRVQSVNTYTNGNLLLL